MRNSPAEKKSAPARSTLSIPLLFLFLFVSFLLVLLTRNFALFFPSSPPPLYTHHFSLLTASSPAPSPAKPPSVADPPTFSLHGHQSNHTNFVKDGNFIKGSDSALIFQGSDSELRMRNASRPSPSVRVEEREMGGGFNGGSDEGLRDCDLYKGKWVRDESGGYPIYEPGSCPFVDEGFLCQSNGRPDSGYLRWRWKPDACQLPRFNAADLLERLRGRRLTLVGDSMGRNQFESLLCLLREGITDKTRMYEIHGFKITKGRGYYVFKFVDYNCTVEFIRSHFLVREGVRVNGQGNSNPTLSIDRIDKSSKKWKQSDILVFNTGHWWTHGKTSRGKNYFKERDEVYSKLDAVEAYRRAMKTWGKWIDQNVNPKKQLVFYRGYSSAHFRGGDWDSGGTCNGETEPILPKIGASLDDYYPMKMKIVEEVIHEMQVPIVLLNVTRLTNTRKDGHPSIYGKNATAGVRVSKRREDCSHWCLPGVPDAWNELIYATLVYHQTPPDWAVTQS